jgi:ATP-dependent Clp protease adaptor protein ClpS
MTTTAPVREAPATHSTPTFRVEWLPPYRVIVHNNDHNTFDEVIAVLMMAVPGMSLEGAIGYTYEIHLTGAAVVFKGDVEEAEDCARVIRSIGIKVTVEPDDA